MILGGHKHPDHGNVRLGHHCVPSTFHSTWHIAAEWNYMGNEGNSESNSVFFFLFLPFWGEGGNMFVFWLLMNMHMNFLLQSLLARLRVQMGPWFPLWGQVPGNKSRSRGELWDWAKGRSRMVTYITSTLRLRAAPRAVGLTGALWWSPEHVASFTAEAHHTAWIKAVPQTDAMSRDPRVTANSHASSYGPEPHKPHCFSGKQRE